jgi:hypothetical protein
MQSALEKMENMTKELEKRERLLEKAAVRVREAEELAKKLSQEIPTQPDLSELAPAHNHPRRNSPPLPYNNHDDMYMGDSESNEQRNRAVKKRYASRREKRKDRQREENSDESDGDRSEKELNLDDDSNDEAYKRKRKAVKKGKAPQREENSDNNPMIELDEDRMGEDIHRDRMIGSDEDEERMFQKAIFAEHDEDYEDYEVVDADMASPLY